MMTFRHNDPISPHERARSLASDRLSEPLRPADAEWLDTHLADCEACRAIAEAYATDHELFVGLAAPLPPRDLWARTSAGIDRERSTWRRGTGRAGRRRLTIRPDAMAGILAVLVVGLLVGRGLLPGDAGTNRGSAAPSEALGPGPTPLEVRPADVTWVAQSTDGSYSLNYVSLGAVCPADAAPAADCSTLDVGAQSLVSFPQQPKSVILAPNIRQAAVVESNQGGSGGSIVVVDVSRPSPEPTQPPTAPTSPGDNPSPTTGVTSSPDTNGSPSPTAEAVSPSASPASPSASPSHSSTPSPSASSSPAVPATSSPAASSPAPTAAAALAIIDNVVVVGGDAAYAPDGSWLAFSARPADGSAGPDIYVWRPGDEKARALTTDHASIFSSWVGSEIAGSRSRTGQDSTQGTPGSTSDATHPSAKPSSAKPPAKPDAKASKQSAVPSAAVPPSSGPVSGKPSSFLVDPATGDEQPLAGTVWRPVVDPTGRWVVYWTGTLKHDPVNDVDVPDAGGLVIDSWPATTSADPQASSAPRPFLDTGLTTDPAVTDWDVRWDPTGQHLGVWVADPLVAGLGRLSLVTIDPATGLVQANALPGLRDVPALAGFSIGDGRIVWATPPGQNGDGSSLQVFAWQGSDTGGKHTDPGPGNIVVAR